MNKINKHAKVLFDFLSQQYPPHSPDFILVLGSNDLSVAVFAAEYYAECPTDYIVISGGFGKITTNVWETSEARKFSEVMIAKGVPRTKIYLDEKATNTGENICNAKEIILTNHLPHKEGVIITKPYMTKRAFNTASKQWQEVHWAVISENVTYEQYLEKIEDKKRFLNLMVGDLQRIKTYGKKGFQIEENIPDTVWSSFEYLVHAGYDEFIIDK